MLPFIVVPAYNEENTIYDVINNAKKHVENIIVVDDSSSDRTKELAEKAGAIVISTSHNLGYDGALELGFKSALKLEATSILTLDADGQHPSKYIKTMINLVELGQYQLVLGRRNSLPRITEKLYSQITQILYGVGDITCGMKCYNIELYKDHGAFSKSKSIGTELAITSIKKGSRFTSLAIEVQNRKDVSRFGNSLASELSLIRAALLSFLW